MAAEAGMLTFQHTERRPAVIGGSLCEDTEIFNSVKEWNASSCGQYFLVRISTCFAVGSCKMWARTQPRIWSSLWLDEATGTRGGEASTLMVLIRGDSSNVGGRN
jgi:hypothetical protein